MKRFIAHVLCLAVFVTTLVVPAALSQEEGISYVPSIDYKSFLIKQALKSSKRRDRVIAILLDLFKDYPEDEEKAQLKIRLAQLYLDKARHLYFLELYKHDPEAKKLLDSEISIRRRDLKGLKLDSSYAYNRRAIEIFRDVLKKYPRIKNRDEILFYYAYNLGEIGKNDQALRLYRQLIRQYPKSKLISEAYLVQAEYYFYSGNLGTALRLYRKVLDYPDSKVRDLAQYKIAWCHFNRNKFSLALRTLEGIIGSSTQPSSGLDLRDQSRHDLVVMFSFGGYYKEAPFYFKQVGGKSGYRPMLKQLANLYYQQGKNGYAKATYERLLREDPSDKDNPEFQNRLVEIAKRLGRKEDVIVQAGKLVRFYSDKTGWVAKNRNDWDALQRARDMSEKTLRSIALSLHNEAQKTKDDRTYALAMVSYREYLDNFPDTKEANRLRFYYAEALFKLGKLEQAGITYTQTLETDPTSEFAKQAAYGAIVSYDMIASQMKGSQGETAKESKPGKAGKSDTTPQFIPLWQREMARAGDNFVKYFPKDKRTAQIAFKSGKVFYDYNHFKESVKRFDGLVTTHPKSSAATFAVNLVLDSWNIQQRWDKVVEWGKKYYRNPALPSGKFKKDLYALIEKSSFKVCRGLEEAGRYRQAGEKYLQFVDEFKQSAFVDEALNNAGISFRKAKDINKSIAVLLRLIKTSPKSPYTQAAMLSIGRGYEDLARFQQAAKYYEAYQQRYPQAKPSPGLIYNAAVFRENLGQTAAAIRNYKIYINNYKNQKDIAVTEFSVAMLYEKTKDWANAAALYRQLAGKYRSDANLHLQALCRWGKALENNRTLGNPAVAYQQAVRTYPQLKKRQLGQDTVDLVAEAQYKLVDRQYRAFRKVRLNVSLDRFGAQIKRKSQLLGQLIEAYQKVIDYGSAKWTTIAVYRLGQAYDDFARRLAEIRQPEALQFQAGQDFMQQIQGFIDNMRAKATAAYETCVTKAAELEVFDPIVAKAERRLADLTATSKTTVEELLHQAVYVDDAVGGGAVL